jgi:hypothetical protein
LALRGGGPGSDEGCSEGGVRSSQAERETPRKGRLETGSGSISHERLRTLRQRLEWLERLEGLLERAEVGIRTTACILAPHWCLPPGPEIAVRT